MGWGSKIYPIGGQKMERDGKDPFFSLLQSSRPVCTSSRRKGPMLSLFLSPVLFFFSLFLGLLLQLPPPPPPPPFLLLFLPLPLVSHSLAPQGRTRRRQSNTAPSLSPSDLSFLSLHSFSKLVFMTEKRTLLVLLVH